MHAPDDETQVPRVELRVSALEKLLDDADVRGAHARARFLRVHRTTLARIQDGSSEPSTKFIAQVLTTFAPRRFEDLFTVVSGDGQDSARPARLRDGPGSDRQAS